MKVNIMNKPNPIFGDALKQMMEASSGMNINPYEDDNMPAQDNEVEIAPSSDSRPPKTPKKKAPAAGQENTTAHYHITCPEGDMKNFRAMYLAHLVSGGKTMSFSAYMRQLISQGFRAEPKDVRDEYRRLNKA